MFKVKDGEFSRYRTITTKIQDMQEEQVWTWQTQDGTRGSGLSWPVEAPQAVVAVVHGLGEHIGRYRQVAAFFAGHGIATIGYDRRGHGKSGGKRGHALGMEELLEEIDLLVGQSELRFPGAPVFLYGQSMGGNLVLQYPLRRPAAGAVRGIISSAPWIALSMTPSPGKVALARLVRSLFPGLAMQNDLDPGNISRDPEVVAAYEADPLVHHQITPGLGVTMLEAAAALNSYQGVFPLPLLLMHGSGDQITSHDASRDFASRAEGNVTFKSWPGCYHELHQEPEKEEVLEFALEWLMGQLEG